MLKEIIQFTETALADPIFKKLGVQPREGLHIVLQVEQDGETTVISKRPLFAGVFSKKMIDLGDWLPKCAEWSQVGWNVKTNKCFDLPIRAILTASPFCFGFKRTNLRGGEKWEANESKKKSQVYDRINLYFEKCASLMETAEDRILADAFRVFLNDKNQFDHLIEETGFLKEAKKDGEYIIFYLELPVEVYSRFNNRYLKENLFNTPDYNLKDSVEADLMYGTSDWLSGFPNKKPFLMHQSATFDISGRINLNEAKLLSEFSEMSRRKLFPNPLPLFVMKDEREKAFKLFKDDAQSGAEKRKPYLETIAEFSDGFKKEVGNYYLLFQFAGELRDFDFVSRFEYELRDKNGKSWEVFELFSPVKGQKIENIAQLAAMLPDFFNTIMIHKWFDEIETKWFKKQNNFQMTMKYRKAFYDFIYKSRRESVDGRAIEEILLTGIMDDIRADEFKKLPGYSNPINTEERNICKKLNFMFSLYQHFSQPTNLFLMPAKIEELVQRVRQVAESSAHLENDEHFAFAAGQVLARVFLQNESANRTYKMLEPFFRFSEIGKFRESLQEFFLRYSHKGYSGRFENVSGEVLSFELKGDLKSLRPLILAGVFYRENVRVGAKTFRKTLLHAEKEVIEPEAENTTESKD